MASRQRATTDAADAASAKPVERAQIGRVHALLKAHGWNATSFQTLEAGFLYWFDGPDACVPYVDTGRAWVAAGVPLAPARKIARVAARFADAAQAAGRRAVFFATEAAFTPARFRNLPIGEQPVWDPQLWGDKVSSVASLRAQQRRAANKGVRVRSLKPEEIAQPSAPIRRSVEALIARWLASRPLAPMGFLVDVQPFSFASERRYFIAEQDGTVVGFLAAVPVYARRGWLFEDLLRDPSAPNGTAESLIDLAMRTIAALGSRYVTLGLAPLAGATAGWLMFAKRWAASLYDFQGVHAFRAKLRPDRWDPIHISVASRWRPGAVRDWIVTTTGVMDALSAFARGRLFGFGVSTLLRGPAIIVRLLAALLIPWTAGLALVGDRYFASSVWKWSWVVFDIGLAAGLFALAARWRWWLALGLACAITVDAVGTVLHVIFHNLLRLDHPWDFLVVGIGTAGPIVAATILWHAIGHRHRHRPPNPSRARFVANRIRGGSSAETQTPPDGNDRDSQDQQKA